MVVFYNPHVDDFLSIPPHFSYLKRKPLRKYGYIFDGVFQEGKKVDIFIDYTMSAFFSAKYFSKIPLFIRKFITKLELKKWEKDNKFKGKIHYVSLKEAGESILFAMSNKATQGNFEKKAKNINKFKCVIFHLSHYFISTKEKALNFQKINNLYLCGDSDITDNEYFKKFFYWYKKQFLIVSFNVQERFVSKKPIQERKSKAVATGSFHDLYSEKPAYKYEDYLNFYQCSSYHPIRKAIYENKEKLADSIEVKVSPYREIAKSNFFKKIVNIFRVDQKAYFSFDIVELYNDYKYAVIGEENTGFLAIGALEAMACGCILLVQQQYYRGLELIEGVHYVSYDGSLEHLVLKIHELNQMPLSQLQEMSIAAVKYVERYRSKENYTYFTSLVETISTQYEKYYIQ